MYANLTILGRLGADPEPKEIASGTMCQMSIATNRKRKGEKITDWTKVTCFGRTAEVVLEWLHKGDTCLVSGDLEYEEYTGKDGTHHKRAALTARDVRFASMGPREAEGKRREEAPKPTAPDQQTTPADVLDDIPF